MHGKKMFDPYPPYIHFKIANKKVFNRDVEHT